MELSARSLVMAGVAVVTASSLAVVPSVRPPATDLVASPAIRLSASVQPLTNLSDNIPSLWDQIQLGIVPSLSAPFPTPPTIPGPTPAPTNFEFEDAIINTYHAIEPWVRYGAEWVTWGVGWIPWVGWLAPQIMIFYNFGERIVESLVVNSANWLWGPLPFFEGLGNVAVDSWNALVQLGIDEWNFWLPPLPPLPFAALATNVTAAAVVPEVKTLPEEKRVSEEKTVPEENTVSEEKTVPEENTVSEEKTVPEEKTLPEAKTVPEEKTVREEKTVPASREEAPEAVRDDVGVGHGRTVKSEVTTPRAEPQGSVRGRGEAQEAAADNASAVSARDARDSKKQGADETKNPRENTKKADTE